MRQLLIGALIWVGLSASALGDQNWPQFRGPEAAGVADDPGLPDAWGLQENLAWKAETPGRGWSCPVVWGDRVFLTSVVNDAQVEEAKRGLYFGGERPDVPNTVHHWLVLCYDLQTGKELWQREVHQGPPLGSIHLKNTYASETPATDGEHLFVYFGNLGLFCLDYDGNVVWNKPWGAFKTASGWGTGASPILYGDRLYVVNDNEDQSYVVALDKRTGQEIWRTERDDTSNWATPFIWKNEMRTELIASGTGKVCGYDLNGKLLWQLGAMSHNAIPTPFAGFGMLFVSSGHVMAKNKPLVAIRPGASGDITLEPEQNSNQYVAWAQKKAAPYNPSPLLYQDYIYVVTDGGIMSCYDAKSGEPTYAKKRLPEGKSFTASPWAYHGKVFCLNEYGETFVLKAGKEFEVLGKNVLGEEDMCLATPALAGPNLLIRSDQGLYCFRGK
jgi:outer membrane protein assembly factor BamB